ncbi:MAG TPA: nitroreductase family protein [Opitutaceae bacterium]|nr:nitroreductase family protein [Opitutaceae bacterium]
MNATAIAAPPEKKASVDHPIHELLAARWSPYAFADRAVDDVDLASLFEASRWAASSYNEQPWSYCVATKRNPFEFDRLLSCLVPANQAWAKDAPVLVLSLVHLRFARTGMDNRAAVHDLGLATANLVFEATARGLSVHQMIGILPDRARELYRLPPNVEAWTASAIGYGTAPRDLPEALRERDLAPRQRKPANQFVFCGGWGRPWAAA